MYNDGTASSHQLTALNSVPALRLTVERPAVKELQNQKNRAFFFLVKQVEPRKVVRRPDHAHRNVVSHGAAPAAFIPAMVSITSGKFGARMIGLS